MSACDFCHLPSAPMKQFISRCLSLCPLQSDKQPAVTDVAVKCLKHESIESGRVKFLQEAAIMAQFKHRNVMSLYGATIENGQVN